MGAHFVGLYYILIYVKVSREREGHGTRLLRHFLIGVQMVIYLKSQHRTFSDPEESADASMHIVQEAFIGLYDL
jgi:hypothetical protein